MAQYFILCLFACDAAEKFAENSNAENKNNKNSFSTSPIALSRAGPPQQVAPAATSPSFLSFMRQPAGGGRRGVEANVAAGKGNGQRGVGEGGGSKGRGEDENKQQHGRGDSRARHAATPAAAAAAAAAFGWPTFPPSSAFPPLLPMGTLEERKCCCSFCMQWGSFPLLNAGQSSKGQEPNDKNILLPGPFLLLFQHWPETLKSQSTAQLKSK
jgi:hypothetical protein